MTCKALRVLYVRHVVIARREATKQSSLSDVSVLDCHGPAALAMTMAGSRNRQTVMPGLDPGIYVADQPIVGLSPHNAQFGSRGSLMVWKSVASES